MVKQYDNPEAFKQALMMRLKTAAKSRALSVQDMQINFLIERLLARVFAKPWSRRYINSQVQRIRHMFKWAVAQKLVPTGVHQALTTLEPLRRSNEDKAKAVTRALKLRPDLGNPTVAEHVGVDEKTVRRYREILEQREDPHNSGSEIPNLPTRVGRDGKRYQKTERALQAYLNREPMTKLYATTDELFPLPEESRRASA